MSVPNIEKLFQYLQCISKKPIEYGGYFDDKISEYRSRCVIGDQITQITLNANFFNTDSCQMCGGCCPAESNVYSISEYRNIMKTVPQDFEDVGLDSKFLKILQDGLHPQTLIINDKEILVWVYSQQENKLYLPTREKLLDRCTWCFQDSEKKFKCHIHLVESITCIMPHLRMFHVKGTPHSSIGISQFGRNWALKCPISLYPPENESEFETNKQNRIEKLCRLNKVAEDLNVETYLDQIISYALDIKFENYQSYLGVNIIGKHPKRLF